MNLYIFIIELYVHTDRLVSVCKLFQGPVGTGLGQEACVRRLPNTHGPYAFKCQGSPISAFSGNVEVIAAFSVCVKHTLNAFMALRVLLKGPKTMYNTSIHVLIFSSLYLVSLW